MPYGLSVTAWCVLLSIILPFCFSEQDLLDILLVRHSVDYYHCDCRPNLQTTTAFQLQIAKWVIAVNIQFFLSFSIFQKRTQKNENIIKLQWVFFFMFADSRIGLKLVKNIALDAYSSFLSERRFWCMKDQYSRKLYIPFTTLSNILQSLMLEYLLDAPLIFYFPLIISFWGL